jgi:hypothetical protein
MIIDPILKGYYSRRVFRSVCMCGQTMHLVKTKFLRQGRINLTKNYETPQISKRNMGDLMTFNIEVLKLLRSILKITLTL